MDIVDNEKKIGHNELSEGIEAVASAEPAKKVGKDEVAKATDSSRVRKLRRLSQLQHQLKMNKDEETTWLVPWLVPWIVTC